MTIEEYKQRKGNVSRRTLRNYVSQLENIFNDMGIREVREPTVEDVEVWIVEAKKKYKDSTVSQYCSLLKSYFRTLRLDDASELENALEEWSPKVSKKEMDRCFLTIEELKQTLEEAKPPFDLAMYLGYIYARRLGEVLRLSKDDIDFGRDLITFTILKKEMGGEDGEEFSIYDRMSDEWIKKLREKVNSSRSKIFTKHKGKFQYEAKRAMTEVGVEGPKNFHGMRHSRVRHLLDADVPPRAIKDNLTFHESIATLIDIYGVELEGEKETFDSPV